MILPICISKNYGGLQIKIWDRRGLRIKVKFPIGHGLFFYHKDVDVTKESKEEKV